MREVDLRVRRVLGRYAPIVAAPTATAKPSESERYRIAAGVLDVQRRELKSAGQELVELTDAEFDLLTILVRRPNRILSRDEIVQLLKGQDWSPLDRSLDKHISRLRKKIEPSGETPRLIKSVRLIGYVFTGDVDRA